MTILDCRPFLAVGVSFIAAVLIAFSRRWPNLRETWSVIASVLKFGIILSMLPAVLDGNQYQWTLCQITDTCSSECAQRFGHSRCSRYSYRFYYGDGSV